VDFLDTPAAVYHVGRGVLPTLTFPALISIPHPSVPYRSPQHPGEANREEGQEVSIHDFEHPLSFRRFPDDFAGPNRRIGFVPARSSIP
jgi:hypothetical protein